MSGILSPQVHLFAKSVYLILIISTFTGKEIQTPAQGLANLKRLNPEPVLLKHYSMLNKAVQRRVSPLQQRDGSGARLLNMRFEFEKSLGPSLQFKFEYYSMIIKH